MSYDVHKYNTKRNIFKAKTWTVVTEPNSSVNATKNPKSIHMRISNKIWQLITNSTSTGPLDKQNLNNVDVRNYIIKKGQLNKSKSWDLLKARNESSRQWSSTR